MLYKANLAAAFVVAGEPVFPWPAIEIRRRIYEVDPASAECVFSFEFPDFIEPGSRIASRNIEAWGAELLEQFRLSQDAMHGRKPLPEPGYPICWLTGGYQVVRRDLQVVSVRYDLEMMAFRAAHRAHETRVQNFLLDPFDPLTLNNLLVSDEAITPLSLAIQCELLASWPGLDPEHVALGARAEEEKLSRFVIGEDGFRFHFDEYEVAAYAAGRPSAHLDFCALSGIFRDDVLNRLVDRAG